MAFTYKSTPVTPPDLFVPIDDNILFQGQKAKYDRAIEYADTVNEATSSMFGFTTYGKDAEILSQIEQETKAKIAEIAKENLGDANVQSRISSIINQASSNPHLKGILQRASSYQQELKRKQDFEDKGQKYTSPLLDQAQEYFNSGVYLQDKRFNGQGWVSSDLHKAMKEAREYATKEVYDPKTGVKKKVASPQDVKNTFYAMMQNNPNYQKDLDYSFQKYTKDVNWDDEGQAFIQNQLALRNQQLQEALQLGDQESAEMAAIEINRLNNLSDLSLIGNELKSKYYDNFINSELEKVGYAADVADFQGFERDPLQMKMQDFANQKQLKLYEAVSKGALMLNTTPEAILSGKAKDANGNPITPAMAIAKEQEYKIQEAQARQDIKTEAAKEIKDFEKDLKIEILTAKGFQTLKNDGKDKILVDGEMLPKKDVISNIYNEDMLQKIIETYGSKFGLDCLTCDGKLDGKPTISSDGTVSYQINSRIPSQDEDRTININKIKALILDPSIDLRDIHKIEEIKKEEQPSETPKKEQTPSDYKWSSDNKDFG